MSEHETLLMNMILFVFVPMCEREKAGRCCLRAAIHLLQHTTESSMDLCSQMSVHTYSHRCERRAHMPEPPQPSHTFGSHSHALSYTAHCSAHRAGAYITPVHTSFPCRSIRFAKHAIFFCNNGLE